MSRNWSTGWHCSPKFYLDLGIKLNLNCKIMHLPQGTFSFNCPPSFHLPTFIRSCLHMQQIYYNYLTFQSLIKLFLCLFYYQCAFYRILLLLMFILPSSIILPSLISFCVISILTCYKSVLFCSTLTFSPVESFCQKFLAITIKFIIIYCFIELNFHFLVNFHS